MRRTKKFLSVFLAIMMVLSIVPITTSAAPDPNSGVCGDNLTWSFDENTGTLTISGTGAMDDYGYNNRPWEDFKDEIENVVINDGVTTVGIGAFELCVNVKSITIPESVTTIGGWAFSNCDHVAKLVIPEGIQEIGDGAFYHCDYLDTVVVPGSVAVFGDGIFADCKRLANVTLCDGLTDIGLDTFDDCTSLTDIIIPEGVTSLRGGNFTGCVNLKSITIPVSVTGVGYGTFGDCINLQDVYYSGSEKDWNKIEAYGKNQPLFNATIHYGSTGCAHNYVKVGDVAKTCDVDGYSLYTCICGHSYKADYVEAVGHIYDNGVVTTKPTCTVDGVKTFTCLTCDEGQYTETIPQTGHNYDDGVVTKDPTCTTNGVKTFTCANCGDTYTESVDNVKEHDYQLVVNTSPDTTVCIKTYKCTICGDTYTETVNASGHTRVVIPEFAPTETRAGLTAGVRCSSCDAVLIKQEVIPAFGATDDSSITSSGICGTNLTWTYNDEIGTLTISGTGAMDTYNSYNRPWESYEDNIKSIIIKEGVTTIGRYAFYDCDNLLYVSIPDSVITIYGDAFKGCESLINVEIPDSVTTLDSYAFYGCNKLVDVDFGSGVTSISNYAFTGCSSLIHVVLPESVYFIFDCAFQNCTNLKNVTFSKNVSIISQRAFDGCTALTDVYYSGTETQWSKISFGTNNAPLETATIHYNSTGNIGDVGHKHDFTVVWVDPTCTEKGYVSYSCDCGYEYIQCYDALGHSVEEIPLVLPTTESVGYTRGKKCTTCGEILVEPVVVPIISETEIAEDAGGYIIFTYDEATKTMEFFGKGYMDSYDPIQDSSVDIDERPWGAYGYSSTQYVVVHEGIKGINELSFYYFTGLKMISLPSSLEWIGDDAFYGCKNFATKYNGTEEEWKKVEGHYGGVFFSDSSTIVASGTHGDNLTWTYDGLSYTLTISGIGAMENVAYNEYPWHEYWLEVDNIIIEEGVTTIGDYAFYDEYRFKNITIPNTVTSIGYAAFYDCNYFKSITIPSSVTSIGDRAFYSCDGVEDVYYLGTEEMWNNISVGQFGTHSFSLATIHFVSYSGICGNNLTWTFDESTGTLTISGTGAMHEYEVDFGGYIYRPWEDWADEIKHIVIADGVTSISRLAFSYCVNLESVTLGSGVTTIGDYAFYYCESLIDITFPDSLTEIGLYAFCGCESLTSVIIPFSVQTIDNGAFRNCTNLEDVYYEGTEEQWIEIIPRQDLYPSFSSATIRFLGYTGVCGDNLRWTFDDSTGIFTISGTGEMYDYHDGDSRPWKEFEDDIIKVIINNGVTTIGRYAFLNFSQLTSITIPDSVTTIGYGAFLLCTSLTTVTIPDGVTTIGEGAFAGCFELTSIVIPDSVTTICIDAFLLSFNLEDIYYGGSQEQWNQINGSTVENATVHYNYGKTFTGIKDDYFYKDDVIQKAYQLVEFDGDFYFINNGNKIAKNTRIYLSQRFVEGFTFADGTPLTVGYYEFDADGKMIILNGVVGDYFYKNNVRLNAYQLVEFEGDFYFINDSHKLAKNKRIYLSERFVEGTDLKVGYYEFDADGKLVMLNGPVGDYFYKNGVQLKAYQLVEFEGDYYFINDSHKLAKNKRIYLSQRFVEGTDLKVGYYDFDADGKLIVE